MHAHVRPGNDRKFLPYVGFDRNPKAVINTQRMICANQVMLRETLRVPEGRAAVIARLAAVESHVRRQPQYRA